MNTNARIISFAATRKPAEALKFYSQTLELRLVSDDVFAMVFDVNGTMLRVQKVRELQPAPHTILGWDVPDIASEVAALKQRGVCFERYEGLGQDTEGIWAAPSGAKVAWFKDPDGNVLSLTQFPGGR